MTLVHGTCVSVQGKGVLLLGPSGSGKSDLALRLIDGGAALVSDDQVEMSAVKKTLIASAPRGLEGLFEVRGVGIFQLPYEPKATLSLAVTLVTRSAVERMPEQEFWGCLGLQVPLLSLHAFDDSICAKIRLILQTA